MSKSISYFVLGLSLVCFSGACAEQKGRKKKDDKKAEQKDAKKDAGKPEKEDKE